MKADKITGVYILIDVLDSGPFEGETLYNMAYEYGRHDLCLIIASRKRLGLRLNLKVLTDFKKNVNLYEETGEQQYKDLATGRYYHRILWQKVIDYIAEGRDISHGITSIKYTIIEENKLPRPWRNLCYACISKCGACPIDNCNNDDSTFVLLCRMLARDNREEAIKQAKAIMEAWKE